MAACETKIVVVDLLSGAFREMPRTAFDGKAPAVLALMYNNSSMLLGMSPSSQCNAAESPLATDSLEDSAYLLVAQPVMESVNQHHTNEQPELLLI